MSPFLSDPLIVLTVASSARPAAAFEISACRAIASIKSSLFTAGPPISGLLHRLANRDRSPDGLYRIAYRTCQAELLRADQKISCTNDDLISAREQHAMNTARRVS